MIESSLGFIPAHFELFATIDIEAMRKFAEYNFKMMAHPKIDKNILPFLRLQIAKRECRAYCTIFNTQMTQKMMDGDKLPYNKTQELLLEKIIKALYETQKFGSDDLDELKQSGFENRDFFDLLSYSSDFMAKSKMIEIYLKKGSLNESH
jgi:hypothetical protein